MASWAKLGATTLKTRQKLVIKFFILIKRFKKSEKLLRLSVGGRISFVNQSRMIKFLGRKRCFILCDYQLFVWFYDGNEFIREFYVNRLWRQKWTNFPSTGCSNWKLSKVNGCRVETHIWPYVGKAKMCLRGGRFFE